MPSKSLFLCRLASPFTRETRAGTERDFASHSSIDSAASCSSWASSSPESASYSTSIAPPAQKSKYGKIRDYPAKCKGLIISMVSLFDKDSSKHDDDIAADCWVEDPYAELSPLDPIPRITRTRNSFVLPQVPRPVTPDVFEWEEGSAFTLSPHRATLACPPPLHTRAVRFSVPRPKFAPPRDRSSDDEPVWSDFM